MWRAAKAGQEHQPTSGCSRYRNGCARRGVPNLFGLAMRRGRAKGLEYSCAPTLWPRIPPALHNKVVSEMLFVSCLSDGRGPKRKEDVVDVGSV
jgi:hypothetical protein